MRVTILCGPAMVASLAISCSDAAAPPPVPATVQIVSGDGQQGVVGSQLNEPLATRVLDRDGKPIAGMQVHFVVTGGDGVLSSPSAVTNSDGVAEDRWTIGTSASEDQTVQARVFVDESRGMLIVARFHATPHADVPDTVRVVSGDGQTVVANTPARDSLLAIVVDRYGNAVPGTVIGWSVSANAGTLSRTTDTTSAGGYASANFTAGNQSGDYHVVAAVGQLSATFAVDITPPPLTLADLVGTHRLDSLGTNGVPYSFVDGERLISLDGGTLEIFADGTGILSETSSQRNCPFDFCETFTGTDKYTATVFLDGNVFHFGADTGTVTSTGISLYGSYGRFTDRRVYDRTALPASSAMISPAIEGVKAFGDRSASRRTPRGDQRRMSAQRANRSHAGP